MPQPNIHQRQRMKTLDQIHKTLLQMTKSMDELKKEVADIKKQIDPIKIDKPTSGSWFY